MLEFSFFPSTTARVSQFQLSMFEPSIFGTIPLISTFNSMNPFAMYANSSFVPNTTPTQFTHSAPSTKVVASSEIISNSV